MGILDCVASPERREEFEVSRQPISRPRPKELSRSDHDISRRRALPLFASQTSLKNVRDVDFWRQKVLRFLFSPEGRDDVRALRVPLKQLGYVTVTDFISEIPPQLFQEYENQTPDESIFKDDKVFWVHDGIAEPGIFKWQGVLDDVPCIGLQLDRKKAVPFGIHDGKGLFYCKPGHRALVPGEEVIPYKKFLRRFLGLPPKKDSLLGSVRLSAKAIAARNSKPGDHVYLPKERKWATVIWIGKIENETVVDLVYDQPKPEAGKPVSPDEPCVSRSMSLADFIGELESEPNSPTSPVSTEAGPQTITTTVESHVGPSNSIKTEDAALVSSPKNSELQESKHSEEELTSEDETESEDDSASELEQSLSDDSIDGIHTEDDVPNAPAPIKSYQGMENITDATIDDNQRLPSPKRKGFFRFSPRHSKRAKSKSPVRKVESAKDFSGMAESEPTTPQPPPRKSKSTNLFANFKFGKPVKKQKKDEQEKMVEEDSPPKPKFIPKKKTGKSDWGGLFKSRSKGSLQKLVVEESTSPNLPECQTPIDEMIPPDTIPTPPPDSSPSNKNYNERKIERPVDLDLPRSSSATDKDLERSSVQSPLPISPVPCPLAGGEGEDKKGEVEIERHQQTDESGVSESETEEDDEVEVQASTLQADTEADLHEPPPLPKTPLPESDSDKETLEILDASNQPPPDAKHADEQLNEQQPEHVETQISSSPVNYLDKFKESKVRNRPSSFGSFLARIKNQKRKPDGALQSPRSPLSPTFSSEEERPRSPDNMASDHNDLHARLKSFDPLTWQTTEANNSQTDVRTGSPSVSSVDLNENPTPNGGEMQISKTLVKPPKTSIIKNGESEGNQEEIMLELLDVEERCLPVNSPPPTEQAKAPKPKSRNKTFSFTFSRKRKPSNTGGSKDKDGDSNKGTSTEAINDENVDPNTDIQDINNDEQVPEENGKERKQSKTNTFRNSFRRTFSLTRKKQSSIDSNDENLPSPTPIKITKPRPVTLYIDNNKAIESTKNSFRKKRPTSMHVDIKPWDTRHGTDGVDIYHSPNSEEPPSSPPLSPRNPALLPKQPDPDIPKHRIFTTPAFFYKRSKKIDNEPASSKAAKPFQKRKTSKVDNDQPQSPTGSSSDQVVISPILQQPPPLPSAPPPIKSVKRQSSIGLVENGDSSLTKLKSALKQRKEIDSIPKGLKIHDRVLWYSGKGPVPGTVQKLFKDGTDKYTAMVQFDREVMDEPLRLTRDGDAYMVTVEELITPDMFGSGPTPSRPAEVKVTPPTPQTPTTPSVRFDGLHGQDQEIGREEESGIDDDDDNDDPEEHDLPPPFQEEEVSMACGFRRGIQCQDKSCCLETILFTLFYTTNVFDISMLYSNTRDEDHLTRNARRILRKDIVDPLRREGFCGWKAVKKLRDAVNPLSDEWQTMSTDAEVMMFILFDRALKLGKFISYSNEMSDFLHQLVVDPKDLSKSTTVQHLFEASLKLMDKIKLKTIPTPALILEMPRSNDQLMQYKAVIPSLTLHVSHIMDNGPRLCICGMVAKYECTQCTAIVGNMSIVFCDNCKTTADVIHFQLTHETQLSPLNQPVIVLDLAAIICVKGGHYFSFVRCGNENFSPWVYFDGAEIENPKVCIEQNLGMWLDRLGKYPGRYHDALQYPLLTHILQDSHICIYQPREKSSSV